jgi:CelD/BcsL family acetyltransferase involved in cellulose biosynthesis
MQVAERALSVHTRILDGFESPTFGRADWDRLVRTGGSDVVFVTWDWQRAWWESFPREQLLLIVAERGGRPVALAPLFAEEGMVYFVGSGGSDYLDFVGDVSDKDVFDALRRAAIERVPNFIGFRFYHVLDSSPTGELLRRAASRLGLNFVEEGQLVAPALSLTNPDVALAAAQKSSLVRHERFFSRGGCLEVSHVRNGADIAPHLPDFFEQHVARWATTPHRSLFCDARHRAFYERLARSADDSGWLRFTRIDWEGQPIAFHFGFSFRGSFLWYKPSFAIELARRSPGEVLLRKLLLAAIEEGSHTFDFGLGDEPFKRRFASHINTVRTWGLYRTGHGERGTETGEATP